MASKKPKTKVIYRSSITGQIIQKALADLCPNTTERQHVRVVKPTKKKSK